MASTPVRISAVFLRRAIAAPLQAALFLLPNLALAQKSPTEHDVEAAYLFRFSKFLRKPAPAEPAATFDICTLGGDPFSGALEQITASEQVDGVPVRLVHLTKAADGRGCSILFFSAAEATRLDQDMAALHGADVLSVSDIPGFVSRGGMIQFVIQQNRVRFAVNLDAVAQTRLSLGSELLRVASSVTGKPRPEVAQ